MSAEWPRVRLREVLRRSEEKTVPIPGQEYREVTVRLWGKGVIERSRTNGGTLSGNRFIAREGQFIISRIDARNGAMGLVPASLDGALVSNDFPLFSIDTTRLAPAFLEWLSRTRSFAELCQHASEGTTNRVRLQEDKFLALEIPLPSLEEQQRIVAKIEQMYSQIKNAVTLQSETDLNLKLMLLSAFSEVAQDSPRRPMGLVAPLIRRAVIIDSEAFYPELGIRSFGNGTFHKPALSGHAIGGKKIYKIEPGDLLFSNVFAWEGAIAVATPQDANRFGSHRYITCVPEKNIVTPRFLCFYFLTDEGLNIIRAASPGGAGRNRTLGLQALAKIRVPIPEMEKQLWFNSLQVEVDAIRLLQTKTAAELDTLLPAILDRAFKGEL